jgi:anti-anti-sigma factor
MQQSGSSGTWENYGYTWVNPHPLRRPWEDFMIKALSRQDFRICSLNGVPVITTPAELDINNVNQLSRTILGASAGVTVVVVDMTATTFIDCYSLGLLMRTYRCLEENGIELRVAATDDRVRWLMAYFGDDQRILYRSNTRLGG